MSARSNAARSCTGSPCDTITCSNGSSSSARSAGSTACSCHGVAQTRSSPSGAVMPSAKTSVRCSGQPHRRLLAAPPVVLRHEPAGQHDAVAREIGSSSVSRNVVAEEQPRPEGARPVALDEDVDVAHVVGLEDRDDGRRARVDPRPERRVILGRRDRVEQHDLAARLDAGAGDRRRPLGVRGPVGVRQAPDPHARRHVAELDGHAGTVAAGHTGPLASTFPRLPLPGGVRQVLGDSQGHGAC